MNDKTPMSANNRKRSKIIAVTLESSYQRLLNGDMSALTTMLADIRHFCDYRNISFAEVDNHAKKLYLGDKEHS